MKKVIVADAQGFCSGVRNALEIVSQFPEASILGDLIHNKQVIQRLEQQNKRVIHDVTGREKHPIIITAHGTTVQNIERLQSLGLKTVDTTCPLVASIYRKGAQLEKQGYRVLIIGDREHVEVLGIASRLHDPIIINSQEELSHIKLPEKIGVICQTTYLLGKFEQIVECIGKTVPDMKVLNTICAPTRKRQEAAKQLTQKVDIMIVIGGYHSSNTRKLAELTALYVETHHVETAADVREDWFAGKSVVGITAGASTPDWIIEDVKKKIAGL